MKKASGFSVIELLIVVAIISDIAVIAAPSFLRSRQLAQNTRFMNDLRTAVDGFEMYTAEHAVYPPATNAGVVPPGMQLYLGNLDWTALNSLSGQWKWDNNTNGSTAAVGVQFPVSGDDVRMADIDTRIDNGVLTTGGFRKKAVNLYSWIIE